MKHVSMDMRVIAQPKPVSARLFNETAISSALPEFSVLKPMPNAVHVSEIPTDSGILGIAKRLLFYAREGNDFYERPPRIMRDRHHDRHQNLMPTHTLAAGGAPMIMKIPGR